MGTVDLAAQVECIQRELKYRKYVYPRRIGKGQMTQQLADRELERMAAVLATLEQLLEKQEFELT